MKKIYFAPDTKIVKVKLQQMIAGSPTNQTLNIDGEYVKESSEIGSRSSRSIWDDEDEE